MSAVVFDGAGAAATSEQFAPPNPTKSITFAVGQLTVFA
jgi:hypothetical protein